MLPVGGTGACGRRAARRLLSPDRRQKIAMIEYFYGVIFFLKELDYGYDT